MADDFDPYRKWLGITPKDQPPHHYRLLGIELFESDPDVIEGAADRQMAHLRTFQAGPHSAASQKLLNECSAARITLLNPEKRVEYDRQLRVKLAANHPLPSGEVALSEATAFNIDANRPHPIPLPEGEGTRFHPAPQVGAPGRGEGASPRSAPQPQPLPMAIARPVSAAAPLPLAEAAPVIVSNRDNSGPAVYRRESRSTPLWRQPAVLGVAVALAIFAGIVFALTRGGKPLPEVVAKSTPNTVAVAPAAPPHTDRSAPTKNESNAMPTTAPPVEPPPVGPAPPALADFEILGANWGTGDKWVDVTDGVRGRVKDNRLLMIVWTKLFGDPADPAPGEGKRLSIRYRSRGNECSADYSDLWFVYLDGNPLAPPTSSPRDLELLEARYGAGAVFVDVLPRLRGHLNNGRLAVAADIFAADTAAELEQQGIGRNIYKVLWVRYRNEMGENFTYAWNSDLLVLDSRMPPAAAPAIDLIQSIDLTRDARGGDWKVTDGVIEAPPNGRLQLPTQPPDDYLLTAITTPDRDGRTVDYCIVVPVGGNHALSTVDGFGATTSGLSYINGAMANAAENPSRRWRFAPLLAQGRPNRLVYVVHPTSVRIYRDGAELVRWSGDPRTISFPDDTRAPGQSRLALHSWVPYRFSKLELTPLKPERAPMLIVGESGAPLDVMKAIELNRDRLHGDWQFTGQTLVTPGAEGDKLQLPAIVPESYQLDLVAEREAGSDGLTFTIPIAGAQAALSIDGWQGKLSGLEKIDDKRIDANETKHEGSIFADGKPHAIHITVRKNHVRLVCDGKPLVDWTGDVGRLKPLEAFPYKDRIYVGDWQTRYRLTNIKIRAFPGDAADGSPPALAAGAMPSETASPRLAGPAVDANLASGVDTRLPEPDEAAQKTARAEMRKEFVAALKSAAKSVEKKRSLAEEMAQKATADGNQGAMSYVLLKQAIDLAESAGEIELAWQIIDQLAKTFAVYELALRNESLSEIGKGAGAKSPQRAGQLTDAACRLMTAALAAGDATALKKAATQAQSFARRTNDKDAQKEVSGRAAGAGEWAAKLESVAQARETLKTSPDDPAANLAVGRFQLCALGDVDSALPKLAKSGDTAWKKLANDELALANRRPTGPRTFVNGRLVTRSAPAEAQRELATADAWWSRGEEEPWPGKHYLRMRAATWYGSAYRSLLDAGRARAGERLKTLLATDDGFSHWELFNWRGMQQGDLSGETVRMDGRGGGLETTVEYDGPIDVTLSLRTSGTEIRFGSHNWGWNWKFNVTANEWHTVRYIITPVSQTAIVDGVPMQNEALRTARELKSAPVYVDAVNDNVLELRKFIVKGG